MQPAHRIATRSFLSAVLLTGFACATTLFVRPDAPGPAHDGASWSTAFTDITSAVAASASGDEIWVAAGTYSGAIALRPGIQVYGGFAGSETQRTQRSVAANPTTLDGAQASAVVTLNVPGAATVLDGFTIRNASDSDVYCANSLLVVAGCSVSGSKGAGIVSDFGGQLTVVRTVVRGNAGAGIVVSQSDAAIADCLVAGNGSGIACELFSTADIVNVTVADNAGAGLDALDYSSILLADSIVAFNGTGVSNASDQPSAIQPNNNDVFGNTKDFNGIPDFTGTRANIKSDPLFVSRPTDYHLQPLSPATDTGDDSSVAEDIDLDGVNRIQGPHVDMGAYEYAAVATLAFTTQPDGGSAGGALASQPVLAVRKPEGDILTTYTGPVTLSIKSGPPGATIGGTITVNAVAGVATFTNVTLSKGGTNYVLQASGRGLVSGYSQTFLVRSPIVRVSPTGNDNNDGSTWLTAKKTVQSALSQATSPGGEVWVAAGTYTGNFTVANGVGLFGGFYGQEVSKTQRDAAKYPTTLEASAGSVITIASGANSQTSVDGFTITGGTGTLNGTDSPAPVYGGGIVCFNGAPAIRNNTISGNAAWRDDAPGYGGGIYCKGSGWIIDGNTISGSSAQYGAGLYVEGSGAVSKNTVTGNTARDRGTPADSSGGGIAGVGISIVLSGNTVQQNQAGAGGGGGVWLNGTSLTIASNTVTQNLTGAGSGGAGMSLSGGGQVTGNMVAGNTTPGDGGGIAFSRTFTLTSNVVSNNSAGGSGGGILGRGATGNLFNNTVVGNVAADGGGVSGGGAFVNNIVAFNSSGIKAAGVFRNNDVYGNVTYDYTGTTDPTGTNGNVRSDPYFADRAGDYRLRVYSPLIDAGYDAVAQGSVTDRDGKPRIVGPHVDLGAYEYPVSVVPGTVPVTFLSMRGVGGDYIAGAGKYLFTDKDTNITVSAGDQSGDGIPDYIEFNVNQNNYGHWFNPEFHTYRVPVNLVPGVYTNAQRAPFAAAGHPGIEITGDGRGCNNICGTFTVLDAVYKGTSVVSFAATFEQHCECGTGYLQGVIAYNSVAVQAPYTTNDVTRALAMAAGILPTRPEDVKRLDVFRSGVSAGVVEMNDVGLLLRKVYGADANP